MKKVIYQTPFLFCTLLLILSCSKSDDLPYVSPEEAVMTFNTDLKAGETFNYIWDFGEALPEKVMVDLGDGQFIPMPNGTFVNGGPVFRYYKVPVKGGVIRFKGPILGLVFFGNKVKSADITQNRMLTSLYCYDNPQLTSINLAGNPELNTLVCHNNKLAKLDVSKNPKLISLRCMSNELTSLDISKNPNLEVLACSGNRITKLEVTNKPNLATLLCEKNNLASLNLSNLPKLVIVNIFENALSGTAIDKIATGLPTGVKGIMFAITPGSKSESNIITKNQVKALKDKGWAVMKSTGGDYQGS